MLNLGLNGKNQEEVKPIPPPLPPKAPLPPGVKVTGLTGTRLTVVILLSAVVAIGGLAMLSSSSTPTASEFDAEVQARMMVEDQLKAPSTAKFDLANTTKISDDESGSDWRVIGTVDAQNSFGAMLRSMYACSLHYAGKTEKWSGQCALN